MVKHYSKVCGTQLQNKFVSGSQQENDWEPLIYTYDLPSFASKKYVYADDLVL